MNLKKDNIEKLCIEAITRVDGAIQKHKDGIASDFNEQVLLQVRSELVKMSNALDSKFYSPMYG